MPGGHPGYSTGFKAGHPSSLLPQPNKETEGAETKYAGEDTTQTQPPALHLTILCVKYGSADIHTPDIICFDKLMTLRLRSHLELGASVLSGLQG